eukprot:XP_003730493.1 PREDICTED: protein sidekick-2 [Strongylocentrotus purpuratus]
MNGRLPARILISAPAGRGKTTAVAKIAYDWANRERGSVLEHLPLLFVVKFRNTSQLTSIGEAIKSQLLSDVDELTPEDGQLVLSASFRLNDRYVLQTFGNLLLQQAVMEDSGEYTCIATNTLNTANASASLIVYQRTLISQKPTNVQTILGETTTLNCVVQHDSRVTPTVTWMQDGGVIIPDGRFIIQESGSLVILSTDANDMGLYVCKVTSIAGDDLGSANLTVLQVPYQPQGVTATKSQDQDRTIIVSWLPVFDGNSALIRYILEQKEDAPDLPPQSLRASATSTSSIMVEFGEPPYDSWNGPLLGYIVQWRMDGYNTAFQFTNITNYRQTSYEITGLITWKIYEIQVAAYNGAGVGAFTNTIDVRTNEGVPTAPPQEVDIVVTSSTSFMYIFSSPPVQFINGINQGYKLLAWEPGMESNPITVLVPPNVAQSRFIGNITTLKKFTEYQASVLCYTNPGDGVPSTPETLMTHEDVPGPVSNLGLNNVYDTSVQVSWEQPQEVNGALSGYSISWQEHNRTSNIYNANRKPNETSYTITALTPLTSYLIQVWAKTSVGPGPTTDILVSSGVPPGYDTKVRGFYSKYRRDEWTMVLPQILYFTDPLPSITELSAERVTSQSYEGLLSSLPGLKRVDITIGDETTENISQIQTGLRQHLTGEDLTRIEPHSFPSEGNVLSMPRQKMRGLGFLITECQAIMSGVALGIEGALVDVVQSSTRLMSSSLYVEQELNSDELALSIDTLKIKDCQLSTEMTKKLWSYLRFLTSLKQLSISDSSLSFPRSLPDLPSVTKLSAERVKSHSYEGLLSSLSGLEEVDMTIGDAHTEDISQIQTSLRRHLTGQDLTCIDPHSFPSEWNESSMLKKRIRGLGFLITECQAILSGVIFGPKETVIDLVQSSTRLMSASLYVEQ